jgi:hypothetical protein
METLVEKPEKLARIQTWIRFFIMAEMILLSALIIIHGLNMYINSWFLLLDYFDSMHLFLWVAALAIHCDIYSREYYLFFCVASIISVVLELIGSTWKVYVLVRCNTSDCSVIVAYALSWTSWAITFLFFLLDINYIVMGIWGATEVQTHINRTVGVVKTTGKILTESDKTIEQNIILPSPADETTSNKNIKHKTL